MVESLKELNRLCQKPRYKEEGNWMVRHILRDAALPLTWLLLHTRVTANQVTFVAIVTGVVACVFISMPGAIFFLIGTFLLQFWYLLDHVDGQIARYRKSASLTGRYYDFLMHHIIHGLLFFALGSYCAFKLDNLFWIFPAAAAAFSIFLFNLIGDTKAKTYREAMEKEPDFSYSVKPWNKSKSAKSEAPIKKERSFLRGVFSMLHNSIEIHVAMNVLTLAAILEIVFSFDQLRILLFLFFGIVSLVLAVVKNVHIIQGNEVDKEFTGCFTAHQSHAFSPDAKEPSNLDSEAK